MSPNTAYRINVILFRTGLVIGATALALCFYKMYLDRQFYTHMIQKDERTYARYKELRAIQEKHYGKVITWITSGPSM